MWLWLVWCCLRYFVFRVRIVNAMIKMFAITVIRSLLQTQSKLYFIRLRNFNKSFLHRTADDCSNNCKTRSKDCGGWTFSAGKCELKKSSRPGDKVPYDNLYPWQFYKDSLKKVPSVGAVSGDPGACGATSGVTSIKCQYTDNSQVKLYFRLQIRYSQGL